MRNTAALVLGMMLGACGHEAPASSAHDAPAHVSSPESESDMAIVHFTAEAYARLAIETEEVSEGALPQVRVVGGEVVVPPGHTTAVAAPVAGVVRAAGSAGLPLPGARVHAGDTLLRLVPIAPVARDVRASAQRDVLAARAQLDATEARLGRVTQLLEEGAGSQRTLEEARVARDVAQAELTTAQARARTTDATPLLADVAMTVRAPEDGIVRALTVTNGQTVAASAPLLEIVAVETLMVRAPVYAGDLSRLDEATLAHVRALGRAELRIEASLVAGPPTADPLATTVDRWLALQGDGGFAPGERVLVELPLRDTETLRTVPAASVVVDAQGASWVYRCEGEHAFARTRIDPVRQVGDRIAFARGPEVGACVASVGAAEIFGSEFEPGH